MGERAGGPLVATAPEEALAAAHGCTGRRVGAREGGRSTAGQITLEEAVALLVEVGLQQTLGGKGALTDTALQLRLDVVLPVHVVTGKGHDENGGWLSLFSSLRRSESMCFLFREEESQHWKALLLG